MRRGESDDLHRIDVADVAKAAAPRETVAVRRNQIPPESELRFQARLESGHQIEAADVLGSFVNITFVLLRVPVETSGGKRVIRIDRAVQELSRREFQQIIDERAIRDK